MNRNLSARMTCLCFALVCWALLTAGCSTSRLTAFAPLEAKLEPASGGARNFVLVNTSTQELHNISGSFYIWNNKNTELRRHYTHVGYLSKPLLLPGQSVGFRDMSLLRVVPFVEPISAVELVGHCDEGAFRQYWVNGDDDQLQRVAPAVTAHAAAAQP